MSSHCSVVVWIPLVIGFVVVPRRVDYTAYKETRCGLVDTTGPSIVSCTVSTNGVKPLTSQTSSTMGVVFFVNYVEFDNISKTGILYSSSDNPRLTSITGQKVFIL